MKIIKLIEKNFFAVGRYWGKLSGGLIAAKSMHAMSSGIPTDDLNWAWNERPLTSEGIKGIKRIKNYYEQLSLPFWWWVYPSGQSPFIKKMMENEGLHFIRTMPCLAADLSALTLPMSSPAVIDIALVQGKKDLDLWEKISFAGFEMDGASQKQYQKFVASFDMQAASPQKLLLACFEGKPAATALLFFSQDAAGIYFVATLPAFRKRGVGLAVTLAAMQHAKQAGFQYIILQSSEAGLNVYKQAGFQEYCGADIYGPTIAAT